nr:MAG TPA: hypothetical protein [Caudoviricetes sp.]
MSAFLILIVHFYVKIRAQFCALPPSTCTISCMLIFANYIDNY